MVEAVQQFDAAEVIDDRHADLLYRKARHCWHWVRMSWDRLEKAVRVDVAVAARIVLLRDLHGRPPRPRRWRSSAKTRSRCWYVALGKG